MARKTGKANEGTKASPGGFGLGGLFDGMQKLMEAAARMKESGGTEGTREFQVPGLGEGGKGIFGFSVRTLGGDEGGDVEVRPFGNVHKTEQGIAVEEARQAVVDVFEEDDCVRVIAELPGANQQAIRFEVQGDVLRIWTDAGRRYETEVLLPHPVDPATPESSYNNGVYEVRFAKH